MTNWKELIEKIRAGEATSYEQAQFEEKRQEFVFFQEYLLDEEWRALEKSPLKEEGPAISYKKMKREINRRLIKKILWVLLILVGIGGVGFYVAQQLMDRYYYNPMVTMEGNRISDLSTYEMLYNELMYPDYEITDANVERTGPAEYRLDYQYQHVYEAEKNVSYTYEIIRGKKKSPMNPLQERFTFHLPIDRSEGLHYQDDTLKKVKEMPKSSSLYGYYIFKEPLTPEELIAWIGNAHLKDSGIEVTWMSVKNQDESTLKAGEVLRSLGMNLWNGLNLQFDNPFYGELNLIYPELFPHAFNGVSLGYQGKTYEDHYRSVLQYLIDEQEQLDYLSYNPTLEVEDLQEALDYVNENGVKIDGVYVAGNVETFIQYAETEEVLLTDVYNTSLYSQRY
ncbi:anti sigma factor C-terminal domain-containing protein [Enterococcus sp. LJL98]